MKSDAPPSADFDWRRLPTLPGHWPGLGHLVSFLWTTRRVCDRLRSEGRPLYRYRAPWVGRGVLWNAPEAVDIFRNQGTSSGHMGALVSLIIGRSMLSADGAEHRQLRRICNRPFSPGGLRRNGVADRVARIAEQHAARLVAQDGFVILRETRALALDVIFQIIGVPAAQVQLWVRRYRQLVVGGMTLPIDLPLLPYWWARRARRWLDARLRGYVDAARQDPSVSGLLADLVRSRDEQGRGLDDDALLDNLRLLVLAGYETTSSITAWCLAYIFTDPALLRAVQDEVQDEVQAGEGASGGAIAPAAYPLVEGIFREAARLHPPFALPSRVLTESRRIGDVTLPAGTPIAVSLPNLCRDPTHFAEPDRFDPRRWAGRTLGVVEKLPFGAGPHFCLGYHLALLEAVHSVVALVRALRAAGRTLVLPAGLPREEHIGFSAPKARDTRCRVVAADDR